MDNSFFLVYGGDQSLYSFLIHIHIFSSLLSLSFTGMTLLNELCFVRFFLAYTVGCSISSRRAQIQLPRKRISAVFYHSMGTRQLRLFINDPKNELKWSFNTYSIYYRSSISHSNENILPIYYAIQNPLFQ